MAPYQVDESLVQEVLGDSRNENLLIRILTFAAFFACDDWLAGSPERPEACFGSIG